MSTYDAELSLAVGRQRSAELRAEAAHERLARSIQGRGSPHARWWRWGRSTRRRPDEPIS